MGWWPGLMLALALLGAEPAPETKEKQDALTQLLQSYDQLQITGELDEALPPLGGSSSRLSAAILESWQLDDIHQALALVPGVYMREEDGFGLRPNIGMRGVAAERSKKITLMEDGILMAPAPYSAPAAYYFPLMARMSGVEVFKGADVTAYGPNTVGGAVNLLARQIPEKTLLKVDLAAGQFRFGKFAASLGGSAGAWGWLVDAAHLQSAGFKDIDGGGDPGFNKNEIMFKGRWRSDVAKRWRHAVQLKLGYGQEKSHETYLGLSLQDFRQTPQRRYWASADDLMQWHRTQMQLSYTLEVGEDFDGTLSVYRHDFWRRWKKLNGFAGSGFDAVLQGASLGRNKAYRALLTGQANTADIFGADASQGALLVGDNDRTFVSQGVQWLSHWRRRWGAVQQELQWGVRWHQDQVQRDERVASMQVQERTLVPVGTSPVVHNDNTASAKALALFATERLQWERLTVTPGMRLEWVMTAMDDRLRQQSGKSNDLVLLPSLGVDWRLYRGLHVFAGVTRGFSPLAPQIVDATSGQEAPRPESSLNYELGIFYQDEKRPEQFKLVGFFNDYQNVTGTASFGGGDAADVLGRQFNGGAATVYGVEVQGGIEARLPRGLRLPVNLNYTWTRSRFATAFESPFSQWGDVAVGDVMPYLPEHQGRLEVGMLWRWAEMGLALNYVGAMRDQAGQDSIDETLSTDAALVLNAHASVTYDDALTLYAEMTNVLDNAYIVSWRPFGARPGMPRRLTVGIKGEF